MKLRSPYLHESNGTRARSPSAECPFCRNRLYWPHRFHYNSVSRAAIDFVSKVTFSDLLVMRNYMQFICTYFSFRQMNMAYHLRVHWKDLYNGNMGGLYSCGTWFEFLFCQAFHGVTESPRVNSRVIPWNRPRSADAEFLPAPLHPRLFSRFIWLCDIRIWNSVHSNFKDDVSMHGEPFGFDILHART
jgi:hypothetical protein